VSQCLGVSPATATPSVPFLDRNGPHDIVPDRLIHGYATWITEPPRVL
jgi:hypothetical protein